MSELIEKLNAQQLTAVLCSVAGAVVLVVFILSILHYQLRALADGTALTRERQNADVAMQKEQVQADIALKQELVKRNLPPEELKLVLETLGAVSAEEAEAEDGSDEEEEDQAARVLKLLAYHGDAMDGSTVEETIALVAAADPAALPTLAETLDDASNNGNNAETIYAVARAFCKAHPRERAIDLQFEGSGGA